MMKILVHGLDEANIPFAVIGAIALESYGLPRFTADIDILSDDSSRDRIRRILEQLDFTCFQMNENFAQFDSEMGVYGKIDCMFVRTEAGKDILRRRIPVSDSLMGGFPVVRPEDYIILKLLAIANNPERNAGDAADIAAVLKALREKKLPEIFPPLHRDRLMKFAEQFRQKALMEKLWKDVFTASSPKRNLFL